jgi:tetratricopeptide (TPR) repeat protein
MSLEAVLWTGIALTGVGAFVGWTVFSQREQQRRFVKSKYWYEAALGLREAGSTHDALVAAARAAGEFADHSAPDALVAQLLEDLGQYSTAIAAWSRARHCPATSRDWHLYYYYRECQGFLRADNWEFAFLRSRDAIGLIETKHLPSSLDDLHCEAELRALHMVAALHHLRGSEAWHAAREQGAWLAANARDPRLQQLGKSIASADDARQHLAANLGTNLRMEPYDPHRN